MGYDNRFYIASSVKNILKADSVRRRLSALGYELSYDWMSLPQSIFNDNLNVLSIMNHQLQAIESSKNFFLLLPGGRGAHIELGYAIGTGKKITVLYENIEQLKEVSMYSTLHSLKVEFDNDNNVSSLK